MTNTVEMNLNLWPPPLILASSSTKTGGKSVDSRIAIMPNIRAQHSTIREKIVGFSLQSILSLTVSLDIEFAICSSTPAII